MWRRGCKKVERVSGYAAREWMGRSNMWIRVRALNLSISAATALTSAVHRRRQKCEGAVDRVVVKERSGARMFRPNGRSSAEGTNVRGGGGGDV